MPVNLQSMEKSLEINSTATFASPVGTKPKQSTASNDPYQVHTSPVNLQPVRSNSPFYNFIQKAITFQERIFPLKKFFV